MAGPVTFDFVGSIEDTLHPDDVRSLIHELSVFLEELSKTRGNGHSVHWKWASDLHLPFAASANGLNNEALTDVASLAQQGFKLAREKVPGSAWPGDFSQRAKQALNKIMRLSEQMTEVQVQVDGQDALVLEASRVTDIEAVRRRHRSSVEGVLRTMADYGGHVEARLREHRTGRNIRCRFDGPFLTSVEQLFRKRVLINGLVSYSRNGEPLYVSRITNVQIRTRRRLTDFIGAAAGLTGDLPAEDFRARMYGDDD